MASFRAAIFSERCAQRLLLIGGRRTWDPRFARERRHSRLSEEWRKENTYENVHTGGVSGKHCSPWLRNVVRTFQLDSIHFRLAFRRGVNAGSTFCCGCGSGSGCEKAETIAADAIGLTVLPAAGLVIGRVTTGLSSDRSAID